MKTPGGFRWVRQEAHPAGCASSCDGTYQWKPRWVQLSLFDGPDLESDSRPLRRDERPGRVDRTVKCERVAEAEASDAVTNEELPF